MHDLRLPGSKGNIDHLVVGPGGAFVVLTRRSTEAITYRLGQLWAGDLPLRDTLDAAKSTVAAAHPVAGHARRPDRCSARSRAPRSGAEPRRERPGVRR